LKGQEKEQKDIFFRKFGLIKSNFQPKIKVGDKCHFNIKPSKYFLIINYEKNCILGEKGDIATDINIFYRPIPRKLRPKQQVNNGEQPDDLRSNLFILGFASRTKPFFKSTNLL